jgi:hypothetical protein
VDACRHVVRIESKVVSLPGGSDGRMNTTTAEIVREYGAFPDVEQVHGVTYDGQSVWLAAGDRLHAFDPANGKTVRSLDVAGHAGTRVLAAIPAPGGGGDSGPESDGGDRFFCGGGGSGKVRAVRRPRRGS